MFEEHATEVLRARGCAMTPQRRAILRYLDGNLQHPTAYQIFEAVTGDFPITSRATVYNTLALLEELGLVKTLRDAAGEVRYDPRAEAHHHLVCERCGALEDVPAEAVEVRLHGALARARVTLQGTCAACAG